LPHRLHRVGVEQERPFSLQKFADVAYRLERADLVVRGHDRDEDRLVGQRLANLLRVDLPVLVHREVRHLVAVAFRGALQVSSVRLVLGRLRDDVVCPFFLYIAATPLIARLLLSVRARW